MAFEWTPDFWQGWREDPNPYRRFNSERDRALTLEVLRPSDGEKILEVGCGYGWITEALHQAAKVRWTGVDRSEAMIRQLRTSLARYSPGALRADACRLPFPPDSFDKVISTGVLMHVEDEFAALGEMARVLRPGGLLVCSMNNSLSPFSLVLRVHNLFKKGFVQNYRSPARYRSHLRRLGIKVEGMRGDGLFVTVVLSIGRFSFPPRFAFPVLRDLDQWLVKRIPWMAYEVWYVGTKVRQ